MARAIDSEAAYRFLSEQLVKETGAFSKGVNKGLNIARSAMRNPDAIPTLTPPNEPLTLKQLREMDGEPAWWDDGDGSCWGIISVDSAGMWGGMPFFRGRWREVNFEYNIEERKMKIYRRPPEGEEDT